MDLKECFLEDVLGRGAVAEEAHEEVEKLALISFHELRKARPISAPICCEQIFIRQRLPRHVPRIIAYGCTFPFCFFAVAARSIRIEFLPAPVDVSTVTTAAAG